MRRVSFRYGSVAFFNSPPPRFAVVVSKKVAARAVDRNRIRRRVVHLIRAHVKRATFSAVVYPNREAERAPHADLSAALAEVLSAR